MEVLIEQIIIYGGFTLISLIIVFIYLNKKKKQAKIVKVKIEKAIEDKIHEPVSLHPDVDLDFCIGSGACITACPEKDILGLINGRATLVNASECIGHGACLHACPVEAISLVIGTEKRGVDLPHVNETFESNIKGIYIAGELGGMGLIRNGVEQGMQAVENIVANGIPKNHDLDYDLIIIGAGPAGVSATLTAKQNKLKFLTVDQDTLGGTVNSYPRTKIIMTQPMFLPTYGKVKLYETSKQKLLDIWNEAFDKNNIKIREKTKIEIIERFKEGFKVISKTGEEFTTKNVLLTIGRRGSPRKLNVPGEEASSKVFYRLLEPERMIDQNILVVGGGDSALESAMLLMDNNNVILSYRKDAFSRAKPKNRKKILLAFEENKLEIHYNTNVLGIEEDKIIMLNNETNEKYELPNNFVYVFIGGQMPNIFLEKIGIEIETRFKYTMKSYRKN